MYAAGLKPGAPYHCALMYTDEQGQRHSKMQPFVARGEEMISDIPAAG